MPYSKNPSRMREYNRAYYLANRERLIATNNNFQQTHPERHRAYARVARRRLKIEGFARLGRQCACCGFDDTRFLTMDHIQSLKRTRASRRDPWREAQRSNWDASLFQILCGNCNLAKRDNDSCPHHVPVEQEMLAFWRA